MEKPQILNIEKIVFGGKGLARYNGQVVFIEGGLPGEKVKVLLKPGKHFFTGKIKEILTPSPFRIENSCKFKECGGCDFRHCSYKYEIELKKAMLIDTLKRIGKIEIDQEFIELHFSKRDHYRIKTGFKAKRDKIGFFKKKSHLIVDIDYCLQVPEQVNKRLKEIRDNRIKKDFFIEIHPFKEETYFYFKGEKGKEIEIRFEKYLMFHKTGNFVQANRDLLKEFVEVVKEFAGEGESLLELYCGSGLFTLPLSFNHTAIHAYEHSESAIEMLEKSIKENNLKNISVYNLPAEDFEIQNYSTIVVDPPREGLSGVVLKKVLNSKPEKIVYISCNASTFARDFKTLSTNYTLERLALIDNFPATAHFETVALLRRR